MKNTLLKILAASTAVLGGINYYLDSKITDNESSDNNKYTWKYGTINYKKTGSGEPLLLLHDLTIYSSNEEWKDVIEILSEKYTLYMPDLPGCGTSCKPEIIYTNYFYVQFVKDFIHNIIEAPVKIMATGLSASIALMTSLSDESLVKDFILINPLSLEKAKEIPGYKSKVLTTLFQIPIIGNTVYHLVAAYNVAEEYLEEKAFYNPFNVDDELINTYYKNAHLMNGKGRFLLASIEGKYVNADLTRILTKTEKNIVIVLGNKNKDAEQIQKEYTARNEHIIFITIPGTKLLPQLEEPEALLAAIL